MKTLRAVIWVGLVLACAVQLSAQDLSSYFGVQPISGRDSATGISPSWVPLPNDFSHPAPNQNYVNTFATCEFNFYYQASTGRIFPISVGLAARHYSGCSGNYLTLKVEDMSHSIFGPQWVIRGNGLDYSLNPFNPRITYDWEADSSCRQVDRFRPWNAAIVVMRELFYGC